MKTNFWQNVAFALATTGMVVSAPVEARTHHHDHRHYRHVRKNPGHGHCLRFNKTTGAITGGVGGAVLGKAIFGGPVGLLAGAAAGAFAGNKLARNGRKHCR